MKKRILDILSEVLVILIIAGITVLLFVKCASEPMEDYEGKIETVTIPPVTTCEPPQTIESQPTLTSLGTFTITYYCPCSACCGKTDGITKSGVKAISNHTIAAPSNFEFGTILVINGIEYTVEDRGSAIIENHIDIFVESHEQALQNGVKQFEVYKIN